MQTKIVFLDFDDVLNTAATLEQGKLFEKANVDVLNTVVDRTDAVIVITSTWRVGATLQELEKLLVDAGVHATGRVIGVTPWLSENARGAEIAAWLRQSAPPASRFIILDNLEVGELNSCLVQTDPRCGLARSQVEEIVGMLNGRNMPCSACQVGGGALATEGLAMSA